jgi:5-methylcytosine-specific restriction endonuclease McrA
MSWDTSKRRDGLPHDWPKIRINVLRRDSKIDPETGEPTGSSKDAICQWIRYDTGKKCGLPANQVDHKDNQKRDDHSLENLQSLCQYHHGQKSAAEGHAGRLANKPVKQPRKYSLGALRTPEENAALRQAHSGSGEQT